MKNLKRINDGCFGYWFESSKPNAKGETMTVEISYTKNSDGNNSLPYLWYKHGDIDKVLETYLNITTYVTDKKGNCIGKYNPQIKNGEICFDWMLEATKANAMKLLEETERRFLEMEER